ncbi:hypothetical protein COV11_02095 [Candidatus Woesearchaeota archaeon CG10_big_fil_rev_8_21_14_0_10_30_7]|nr:MAG: hypothetical protein COV11_02095 [Candidatus Woesearchaeota archaeon CG10_big_fil_rev_8_21_14_0_10_30_7]
MSKTSAIKELTNLLTKSLRHKIGSIVNKNEFYANKYAKDAEVILKHAERVGLEYSWNEEDKATIKEQLKKKLKKELEEKTFIKEEKFEVIDEEINKTLKELDLN